MSVKKLLKKIFLFNEDKNTYDFELTKPDINYIRGYEENFKISSYIEKNKKYLKDRFKIPLNNDIILRNVTLSGERKAIVIFIEGMVSTNYVDLAVIKPLQVIPKITDEVIYNSPEAALNKLISHGQARSSDDMDDVVDEINFGSCAVFIDGIPLGFIMDVRGWEHRSIDKPENEQSIYGPQEAFAEMLRTNSALIRKTVLNEKLICEAVKIGKISKTRGVIMYIADTANPELVNEVRKRIENLDIDYVMAIEEVGMLLEENPFMITTQLLATERPDRTARALCDGRVALLLNGSPRALVFPTNGFELTHSASDAYMKTPYANMSRVIRLLAMLSSIFLPGFYLAITLFHQEMIPTYLLYSISAARENVPFPSVLELLLMDFAFEMIREAGLRMPGIIGSTLGIVGGLILGHAAVSAKIVSPLMIIVIAITGIGSFATTDYSLSWTYRILRLIFILLGAFFGFYGIALGIFVYSTYLGAQKSFGVPFLSPLPDSGWRNIFSTVFVKPLWKMEKRPEFLKPQKDEKQAKISKKWKL